MFAACRASGGSGGIGVTAGSGLYGASGARLVRAAGPFSPKGEEPHAWAPNGVRMVEVRRRVVGVGLPGAAAIALEEPLDVVDRARVGRGRPGGADVERHRATRGLVVGDGDLRRPGDGRRRRIGRLRPRGDRTDRQRRDVHGEPREMPGAVVASELETALAPVAAIDLDEAEGQRHDGDLLRPAGRVERDLDGPHIQHRLVGGVVARRDDIPDGADIDHARDAFRPARRTGDQRRMFVCPAQSRRPGRSSRRPRGRSDWPRTVGRSGAPTR